MSDSLRADLSYEVRPDSRLAGSSAVGQLRRYLTSLLSEGFPPSVSLAVLEQGEVALQAFGGYACVVGRPVPTAFETSYDLASLTKVVCTVTLALMASEQGALDLDDPVVRWLPEYPQPLATLRHLLTHTAGLVDHRPFYATLRGRAQIEPAIYDVARSATPGGPVCYSDLGFMLLGWVLEACFGMALDETVAALVARPLGLTRAGFRPAARGRDMAGPVSSGSALAGHASADLHEIAATELDGDQRPTPELIWGEVHDGNAYALGGVSGHAGLFAPVADLTRFVQRALVPDGLLSARSIALLASRQAGDADDVRGIGWRLEPNVWGNWPTGTIWHTGFTGTSLLVVPERGTAVVLLTNSIHPRRRLEDQAAVRATVHRLLAGAVR
jgi:CubicO group peptidase (beta-lactamase class C family)